jgi:Xaa-Pro aminopeptidase
MFKALFQTFDDAGGRGESAPRLAALRGELKRLSLDGFIVPHADCHQSEYLPASEERIAWLTGFTGSAATVIVLADRAVLFTDGRYTLQAQDQVDPSLISTLNVADTRPSGWLADNLRAGARIGYDPWLHTSDEAERMAKACAQANAALVPLAQNPLDAQWRDRPTPPHGAIVLHDKAAGETALEKITRVRAELARLHADALVISDPQSLAWTFNIRGGDVTHTPVALAFAILREDGRPALYVDPRKLTPEVSAALEPHADMRDATRFERDLAQLAAGNATVLVDRATGADAIMRLVHDAGGQALRENDPIAIMKAVKNAAEIDGARAAHKRDGAALTRFLAWFDAEAPTGKLTEIDVVEALESFRRDTGLLKDVSFPTISGAGPNGAVVHYRVTNASNRKIVPGELFLLDSGGQYEDGTTDVTRTLFVGSASAEMRDRFTRVLKGHIAISRAVFPDGVTGAQLDSFAREHLWRAGLDFDHGTGHGVGSYLSVHEGPARISKLGTVPLRRGMILSNEPGYYKTGAFGIRIENLELVVEAPAVDGAEKRLNAFETLTLAPIDTRLIDKTLMNADEIAWLNAYHARVAKVLSPLVDDPTRAWLAGATRAI